MACFINNSILFNKRIYFPKDFENIFIDILLPKTTAILFGVVYRPPSYSNFLQVLSHSIMNSIQFFILGNININMLDKKNKFILNKGYRFSKEESNYISPSSLTKTYIEFLRTYELSQIIEESLTKLKHSLIIYLSIQHLILHYLVSCQMLCQIMTRSTVLGNN